MNCTSFTPPQNIFVFQCDNKNRRRPLSEGDFLFHPVFCFKASKIAFGFQYYFVSDNLIFLLFQILDHIVRPIPMCEKIPTTSKMHMYMTPCILHLALLHSSYCTATHNNPDLILHVIILGVSEKLLVKEDPSLYHHINQGCLDVDGMSDKEEMQIADVCTHQTRVTTVFSQIFTSRNSPYFGRIQLILLLKDDKFFLFVTEMENLLNLHPLCYIYLWNNYGHKKSRVKKTSNLTLEWNEATWLFLPEFFVLYNVSIRFTSWNRRCCVNITVVIFIVFYHSVQIYWCVALREEGIL